MKLSLTELAAALNIPPGTVERWIRQGRIPARKKDNVCEFSRSSLQKWARDNNLKFISPGTNIRAIRPDTPGTLTDAMENGGVFYEIKGETVSDVIHAGVNHISYFQSAGQRDLLCESLLAREKLMSTGIGKGVAIPHPRTPLDFGDIPAFITTCFLENPVNYQSVDSQPVFVLFILVCPSSKQHLHLLARLSFCLREESFIRFLTRRPDPAEVLQKIAELEQRFGTS